MPFSPKVKKAITTGALTVLAVLAILVVDEELSSLRGGFVQNQFMLRAKQRRDLSINLGGGECEWQPPLAVVPLEIDLWKTLLVGFPSG